MMLKDKVILITGATSGIGAATAEEAARQGAKVVLAGRRADRGEELCARIRDAGGQALFVSTDVSREAEVKALVGRTLEVFGRLDGAFNNAGIPGPLGPIAAMPFEEYRKLISVNLDGVFLCMKYQVPAMQQGSGGSIVNCASILGLVSGPGFTAYTTAKHGILGMTKAVALDFASSGIRANAVLPGPIETEIWGHIPDNMGDPLRQGFIAGVPLQRSASPQEVARPVVFLLSDWASYITGTELAIDGGYLAK